VPLEPALDWLAPVDVLPLELPLTSPLTLPPLLELPLPAPAPLVGA